MIKVSYAFKKDSKNERHGDAAERLLAANRPMMSRPQFFGQSQTSSLMNQKALILPQSLMSIHYSHLLSNEQPSSKAAVGGEEASKNQSSTPQMASLNSVTPKLSALPGLMTTSGMATQGMISLPQQPPLSQPSVPSTSAALRPDLGIANTATNRQAPLPPGLPPGLSSFSTLPPLPHGLPPLPPGVHLPGGLPPLPSMLPPLPPGIQLPTILPPLPPGIQLPNILPQIPSGVQLPMAFSHIPTGQHPKPQNATSLLSGPPPLTTGKPPLSTSQPPLPHGQPPLPPGQPPLPPGPPPLPPGPPPEPAQQKGSSKQKK